MTVAYGGGCTSPCGSPFTDEPVGERGSGRWRVGERASWALILVGGRGSEELVLASDPGSEELVLAAEDLAHGAVGEDLADRARQELGAREHAHEIRRSGRQRNWGIHSPLRFILR